MADEKAMVSLNELNQAVKDAAPAVHAAVAKPQKMLDASTQTLMVAKVEEKGITVEDVDHAMDGFCALCTKVRPLINIGMTFAGWVLTKSQIAGVKLWLGIVYAKFIDKVCA